jgi:hypothetical protein
MKKNEWDKDPDAIKDYDAKWGTWLGTDTINASTWIVPSGITKLADSFTDTVATIWLSGGTVHRTYYVVNRITTVGGRTDDQTLIFHIVDK